MKKDIYIYIDMYRYKYACTSVIIYAMHATLQTHVNVHICNDDNSVCVCICTYVCMYVCMYVSYMHACMHVCMYVHRYVGMHVCGCACMQLCVCVCVHK